MAGAGQIDTGHVEGFAVGEITIGDRSLVVAIADDSALRSRGLMQVEDLGELDGMLFLMNGVVQNGFTMRNTLIDLQIAFFDEAGTLVDVLEMEPCRSEPCPTYIPSGTYRYAVEVPLGGFDWLTGFEILIIKP